MAWGPVDVVLLQMAAAREWITDEQCEEWSEHPERMAALLDGVLTFGGPAVPWGKKGAVWVGLHPLHGELRMFGACSESQRISVGATLTASVMQQRRNLARDEWITWYDAQARRKQLTRPSDPIAPADVVGGVHAGGGATIAIAIECRDGKPTRVKQGDRVFAVGPHTRWFKLSGTARQMAAVQLLDEREGEADFANYLGLRTAIAQRAATLIRAGKAPQDLVFPVNLNTPKRGRRDEGE